MGLPLLLDGDETHPADDGHGGSVTAAVPVGVSEELGRDDLIERYQGMHDAWVDALALEELRSWSLDELFRIDDAVGADLPGPARLAFQWDAASDGPSEPPLSSRHPRRR